MFLMIPSGSIQNSLSGLWKQREETLEEARVDAGLADTRLLLLMVRTLLRLWLRLSSTTSPDGGSTAFGIILDMYVA